MRYHRWDAEGVAQKEEEEEKQGISRTFSSEETADHFAKTRRFRRRHTPLMSLFK